MTLPLVFFFGAAVVLCQPAKPETMRAFQCYVAPAEARMRAAGKLLLVDAILAVQDQLARSRKIFTLLSIPLRRMPYKFLVVILCAPSLMISISS